MSAMKSPTSCTIVCNDSKLEDFFMPKDGPNWFFEVASLSVRVKMFFHQLVALIDRNEHSKHSYYTYDLRAVYCLPSSRL